LSQSEKNCDSESTHSQTDKDDRMKDDTGDVITCPMGL